MGKKKQTNKKQKSKMTETRQRNCASQGPLRGRPQQSGGKGFHPIKGSKPGQLVCTTQCAEPACACHLQSGGGSSLRTNQKTGLPKAQQGKLARGLGLRAPELRRQGLQARLEASRPPARLGLLSMANSSSGHVSMPRKTWSLGHRKRH